MAEHKGSEAILIIVLVAALGVGIYFYVSTKGKNDAIGDAVNKAIGTAEKVVDVTVNSATRTVGGGTEIVKTALGQGDSGIPISHWVDVANQEGFVLSPSQLAHYQFGTASNPSAVKLAPGQFNVIRNGKVTQDTQLTTAPVGLRLGFGKAAPVTPVGNAPRFTVAPTGPSSTSRASQVKI